MNRQEYNQCMVKFITGKDKSKEQRKLDFCIGAKVCSKGLSEEEAEEICSQPKPPKAPKLGKAKRGQSCEKSVFKVAECVVTLLTENKVYKGQALNINSVGAAVTNALIECECPQE